MSLSHLYPFPDLTLCVSNCKSRAKCSPLLDSVSAVLKSFDPCVPCPSAACLAPNSGCFITSLSCPAWASTLLLQRLDLEFQKTEAKEPKLAAAHPLNVCYLQPSCSFSLSPSIVLSSLCILSLPMSPISQQPLALFNSHCFYPPSCLCHPLTFYILSVFSVQNYF